MGEISPWLPDVPWEQATRRERLRVYQRICRKARSRAGYVCVTGWVHKTDADYLMTAWSIETRSELVRAALRHLLRQTQRGLKHLDGPPEGCD